VRKADEILQQALEWMKDGWAQFPGTTEFSNPSPGTKEFCLSNTSS
jgi:hypothetical protein